MFIIKCILASRCFSMKIHVSYTKTAELPPLVALTYAYVYNHTVKNRFDSLSL